MLALLSAHSSLILTVLLTVSELLALVAPQAAPGIVAGVINALKALGAKDQDGQA
jgi:hypothetical protein